MVASRDRRHQYLACQPRERAVALERHPLCKLNFALRPSRSAYREPRLTALDQVIALYCGIKRGFTALHRLLSSSEFTPADIGECLLQSGTRLMTSMSDASDTIFGTLFRTGGKVLSGRDNFDAGMVDALAAAALQAKADVALPLPKAPAHCAQAAMAGTEGSSTMVARFGRTKNLGERAIGHCDPGAVSMAFILQFMYEFACQA